MDANYFKNLKVDNGIIEINHKIQKIMNEIDSVYDLPDFLSKPTLTKKAKFINRKETGKAVIANDFIEKGELVCKADSSLISLPFKYSWQVDKNAHQIGPGALDHNCFDPTCEIDPDTNNFIARRNINLNELLTFNYLTTEAIIDQPFKCQCHEKICFGYIEGFNKLSIEDKEFILKRFKVSNYVKKLYNT